MTKKIRTKKADEMVELWTDPCERGALEGCMSGPRS